MRAEAQAHIDEISAATALLRRFLDWDRAQRRLEELNAKVEEPALWDDPKAAQEVMRERRRLEEAINATKAIERELSDTAELIEMAEAEGDETLVDEGVRSLAGKKGGDLVALRPLGQLGERGDRIRLHRFVTLGLGHLEKLDIVVQLLLDGPGGADRLLQPATLAHHLLRRLGVIPQRRVLDLRVELVEPPQRAVPIEEAAKQRECGIDLVDMGLRFGAHGN